MRARTVASKPIAAMDAARIAARVTAVLAAAALALFAIARPSPSGSIAVSSPSPATLAPAESAAAVPLAARAPVSAALGAGDRAYWVRQSTAGNPAQGLRSTFFRSGVHVTAGGGSLGLSMLGFGRLGALRSTGTPSPVAHANRVVYARDGIREWYANGPLGLEQGFGVTRRPARGGPLAIVLAVSGDLRARLSHGAVRFTGHGASLRYTGLSAIDARGRRLPARMQLNRGRLVLSVNDRGARYPVRVDPIIQEATLNPVTPTNGNEFGTSVAVSGNTVVVGALGGPTTGGAVYVFVEPSTGWANATPTAVLTDSAGPPNDGAFLGVSIAIQGSTIVAADATPGQTNSVGRVDVFQEPAAGGWQTTTQPAAQLTDGSVGGDDLGRSVAISGTTIVAGAPGAQAVQVYAEQGSSWTSTVTPTATLTATNSMGSLGNGLGTSVAIDGGTIVAGAPGQTTSSPAPGAAYVYVEPPTGGWQTANQTSELTVAPGGIGGSVGIAGGTIVAGAGSLAVNGQTQQGAAFVFVAPAADWPATAIDTAELTAPDGTADDSFGAAVAISGTTIAIGAPDHKPVDGAVYIYDQPVAGWATTGTAAAELTASDASAQAAFGYTVGISAGTIAVGAPTRTVGSSVRQGEAYVFGTPTSTTTTTTTTTTTGGTGANEGVPVNTVRPTITGTLKAGHVLACSTGTWTNAPTTFTYQWSDDGTPLPGATASHYTVSKADEGLTLSCAVTAANASHTSAASTPSHGIAVRVPHVAGCPAATGELSGTKLGLVTLGETKAKVEKAYTHSSNHGKKYEDFFCLTPIGVRVGYASPAVVKSLARAKRKRLAGRVIWASTSNARYAIRGIRAGATVAAAHGKLKLTGPIKIGLNAWYLGSNGASTAVLKTRRGLVQEIGIGAKALTGGSVAQKRFLKSFS